jgi:hypothetical protein
VKSACQSWFGAGRGLGVELLGRLDHDEGRAGDQVVGLEQPVHRGLGDEVARPLGEAHGQLPRGQFRFGQRQVDQAGPHRIGDAVPDPIGPRRLVLERLRAADPVQLAPAIESGARRADPLQGAAHRQV